jgi:DNA-binding HxlR family transcriptional regulator
MSAPATPLQNVTAPGLAELLRRGNLFAPQCPSRDILKHVTSRWGVLLLVALLDGTHRFAELRRKVNGISEKMLAQTLQWLEGDGFVERIAHPVVPPRVEYRLTPLGEEIGRKVAALADWIEEQLPAIMAAQNARTAKRGRCRPAVGRGD